MARRRLFPFLLFVAAAAAAASLVVAVSAFPGDEIFDAIEGTRTTSVDSFPFFDDDEFDTFDVPRALSQFVSDAKDLATRVIDSVKSASAFSFDDDEEERAPRMALASLLAADPLAGGGLLPLSTPSSLSTSSVSSFSSATAEAMRPCSHSKSKNNRLRDASARNNNNDEDDALEALAALEAAGADTALFAPILVSDSDDADSKNSFVTVDVGSAADGGVEASAVSVSRRPVTPSPASSPLLDAALDIQYGRGTAGASEVMRRVARWVSSLADSPGLIASSSSSSPSSSAFDAAAEAIVVVGDELAAALESFPGADDAELDLSVTVDLLSSSSSSSSRTPTQKESVVDVRVEASVAPGNNKNKNRITSAMLAKAMRTAAAGAVAAAEDAGVEIVAVSSSSSLSSSSSALERRNFDDDDDDGEDDDLSSTSLFSYSEEEDAFCVYLGESEGGNARRWACARRVPLSRALAAASLVLAAASALVAVNALLPPADDDDNDEDDDDESDGENDVDDEEAILIKPVLWAIDTKA